MRRRSAAPELASYDARRFRGTGIAAFVLVKRHGPYVGTTRRPGEIAQFIQSIGSSHCDDVTGRLDMKSFELSLFADYFQFTFKTKPQRATCLGDGIKRQLPECLRSLQEQSVSAQHGIMNVPVTVEIRDQEPGDDVQAWDHVVEANMDVTFWATSSGGLLRLLSRRNAYRSLSRQLSCSGVIWRPRHAV